MAELKISASVSLSGFEFNNASNETSVDFRLFSKAPVDFVLLQGFRLDKVVAVEAEKMKQKVERYQTVFVCETCSDIFETKSLLTRHREWTYNQKNNSLKLKIGRAGKNRKRKTLKCEDCHKKFNSRDQLVSHIDLKHPTGSLKKYQCDQCALSFAQKKSLLRHFKSFHGLHKVQRTRVALKRNTDGKIECKFCDKIFNTSNGFAVHFDLSHEAGTDQVKQHSCSFCPRSFNLKNSLIEHIRSKHKGSRSFECKFCDKKFDYPKKLSVHVDANHPMKGGKRKKYLCDKCPSAFSHIENFNQHLLTHGGDGTFPCDLCDKVFQYKFFMAFHKDFKHQDESGEIKNYLCDQCMASFKFEGNLQRHLKSHKISNPIKKKNKKTIDSNGPKNFICSTCGKEFFTDMGLLTHIDNQHEDVNIEKRKHLCDQCPAMFRFAENLQRHTKSHRATEKFQRSIYKPDADGKFSCNICNTTYNQASALHRHNDLQHPDEGGEVKRNLCTKCPLSFDLKQSLSSHMRREHATIMRGRRKSQAQGVKPANHECEECLEDFHNAKALALHIDAEHVVERDEHSKRFQCDLCKLAYQFKSNLERHMTTQHVLRSARQRQSHKKSDVSFNCFKVPPKYPCTVCSKTYDSTFSAELHADRMHQIADDESKEFECDYCPRSFIYRDNLMYHFINHHRFNAKNKKAKKIPYNFTCEPCGINFGRIGHFKEHNDFHHQIASEETSRYPCASCSSSFRYKASIQKHMKLCLRSRSNTPQSPSMKDEPESDEKFDLHKLQSMSIKKEESEDEEDFMSCEDE